MFREAVTENTILLEKDGKIINGLIKVLNNKDDTVIIARSVKELQRLVDRADSFSNNY